MTQMMIGVGTCMTQLRARIILATKMPLNICVVKVRKQCLNWNTWGYLSRAMRMAEFINVHSADNPRITAKAGRRHALVLLPTALGMHYCTPYFRITSSMEPRFLMSGLRLTWCLTAKEELAAS